MEREREEEKERERLRVKDRERDRGEMERVGQAEVRKNCIDPENPEPAQADNGRFLPWNCTCNIDPQEMLNFIEAHTLGNTFLVYIVKRSFLIKRCDAACQNFPLVS